MAIIDTDKIKQAAMALKQNAVKIDEAAGTLPSHIQGLAGVCPPWQQFAASIQNAMSAAAAAKDATNKTADAMIAYANSIDGGG